METTQKLYFFFLHKKAFKYCEQHQRSYKKYLLDFQNSNKKYSFCSSIPLTTVRKIYIVLFAHAHWPARASYRSHIQYNREEQNIVQLFLSLQGSIPTPLIANVGKAYTCHTKRKKTTREEQGGRDNRCVAEGVVGIGANSIDSKASMVF